MSELIPIPSPGLPLHYGTPGSPLIVVLHDWYGRTPGLEPLAEALARVGFRVVVPDLYDGVCTLDAGQAEALMNQLDVARAFQLVDEIIDDERAAGSARVGILGFAMGGYFALLHAQSGSTDAVAAYYATLGLEEDGIIPCPVLLQFAETDEWTETGEPDAFMERLADHGTPVTHHVYAATVHSFANANVPVAFDANAAALAFARTASFFEKHLLD